MNKFIKLNISFFREVFYAITARCLKYILMVGHQVITPHWKLRILKPGMLPVTAYLSRRNHTTRPSVSEALQIF